MKPCSMFNLNPEEEEEEKSKILKFKNSIRQTNNIPDIFFPFHTIPPNGGHDKLLFFTAL